MRQPSRSVPRTHPAGTNFAFLLTFSSSTPPRSITAVKSSSRYIPASAGGAAEEGAVPWVIVFLLAIPLRGAGGRLATASGDAQGGDSVPTAPLAGDAPGWAGCSCCRIHPGRHFQKTFFAPFFYIIILFIFSDVKDKPESSLCRCKGLDRSLRHAGRLEGPQRQGQPGGGAPGAC